MDNVQERAASD